MHGFVNVILIILGRYIRRSWYLRFGVICMVHGCRRPSNTRGGRSGFAMGHAVRVWIFFLCMIACRIIQLDPSCGRQGQIYIHVLILQTLRLHCKHCSRDACSGTLSKISGMCWIISAAASFRSTLIGVCKQDFKRPKCLSYVQLLKTPRHWPTSANLLTSYPKC